MQTFDQLAKAARAAACCVEFNPIKFEYGSEPAEYPAQSLEKARRFHTITLLLIHPESRIGDSSLPDDRANFGPEDMHIKDSKRNEITRNVSLTWMLRCVYKFKRLPGLPVSFFAGMFEPGY